jgi:hypothetical protein
MGKCGSIFVVLVMTLLATGCTAIRQEMARQNHLESLTRDHLYQRPLGQVWPEARQLLFNAGYATQGHDRGVMETGWQTVPEGERRYLVTGVTESPTTCRVRFLSQTRRPPGTTNDRQRVAYEQPLAKAWANARRRAFEEGYVVNQVDNQNTTLESQWRQDGNGDDSRLLLQGLVLSERQSVVYFTYQRRSLAGTVNEARDLQLEWQLIEKAEPERAKALTLEAETLSRSAGNVR